MTGEIIAELQARGITAHDLEDTVHALVDDRFKSAAASDVADYDSEANARAVAAQVALLTDQGVAAQVEWMSSCYRTTLELRWALSGYLNLPLAA